MNRNSNIIVGAVLIALGHCFLCPILIHQFSWEYLCTGIAFRIYMHFAFFTGVDRNPEYWCPGNTYNYGLCLCKYTV